MEQYCTQTGNIVPEKIFLKKDCRCRSACTKISMKKKERLFLRRFGVWEILRNKIYCYTKLLNAKLWNEDVQQTEKVRQEIGVSDIC